MALKHDPDKHFRHSIRLSGYDYAQPGAYFITLCTYQRECLFGEITDGKMRLNKLGKVVMECWQWLSKQYPHLTMDEWVVMPNHLHGIIVIVDAACRGGSRTAPTNLARHKPLGRLIGAFKTVSTKRINAIRDTPNLPVWQRNYYEHIIRDDEELNRIRQYIADNPMQWEMDSENPSR